MPGFFTPKQIDFIRENVYSKSYAEISDMIFKKYNIKLSNQQINSFIGNHNLTTGRTGRFEKGHIPFNKGTHIHNPGCEKTQFKPGQKPINHREVGSERTNVDGYVEVKIAEPSKWRPKHLLIWEKAHGKVPKGHVIIFGDGNKANLSIDNLLLVSRQQLVRLNQNGLIKNDIELTKVGITIADIMTKCGELKKEDKHVSKRQKNNNKRRK